MSTIPTAATDRSWSRPVQLYYPEYGPVEGVLGYVVFYYVVDLVTPLLAARLPTVIPALAASDVTTATAIALWVILGLAVLGQLIEQTASNPRTFDSPEERDAFLAQHRPSRAAETLRLGALAAGAGILALTWSRLPAALERLVAAIGSIESLSTIPAETVVVFVGFGVGVALVNYALDRLLVGGLRAFLADGQRS